MLIGNCTDRGSGGAQALCAGKPGHDDDDDDDHDDGDDDGHHDKKKVVVLKLYMSANLMSSVFH